MIVGDNERVVLIRKRRFESILMPGAYWVCGAGVEGEAHNTRYPELTSEWADFIATQRPETVAAHFTVVETGDSEVAVVYFDGKLARVVGPGKRVLYWRASAEVTFERIDGVAEPEVPARLVAPLLPGWPQKRCRGWLLEPPNGYWAAYPPWKKNPSLERRERAWRPPPPLRRWKPTSRSLNAK